MGAPCASIHDSFLGRIAGAYALHDLASSRRADFALRWRLIKMRFSKTIPDKEWRSATRQRRGERGIWQRRYWEHLIRDEKDFAAHMDYVHINPVKHGLVGRVIDWPYSTFHRLVEQAVYPGDWAGGEEGELNYSE